MDDKDFLGYFENLRGKDDKKIQDSCDKIIKVLITTQHLEKNKNFQSLFGNNINEDVFFSLKKCIEGVQVTDAKTQLNLSYCFCQILKKFGSQIDQKKLIDFIIENTNQKLALNKSEKSFFIIGRINLFQAIFLSNVQLTIEIINYIYETIFNDIQQNQWIMQNAVEVIKISLHAGGHFKNKLKTLITLGQNFYQENNFDSLHLLLILEEACNKHQTEFVQENLIKDKVTNLKIFSKIITLQVEQFPTLHIAIKYICSYILRKNSKYMRDLLTYLLENNSQNHKAYLLTLEFLRCFLKSKKIIILKDILIEELWHLWLKNLIAQNQTLKQISQKIMKRIVKMISQSNLNNKDQTNDNKEERQIVYQFLIILKARPTQRFNLKQPIVKPLLNCLNEEMSHDYFKALKKQLHLASDPSERAYYLNEIYILGENKQNMSSFINEICFLIFEESNQAKLKQIFTNIPEEQKENYFDEDQFVEDQRELILNLLYSLLFSASNFVEVKHQQSKNIIYKGIDAENNIIIFEILKYILSHKDYFKNNNKQLYQTIEQLKPYLNLCEELKIEIQKGILNYNKSTGQQEKGFTLKKRIAFNNLIVAICIQALIFPEEMLENLEELVLVYKQMIKAYDFQGQNPTKKKKINNEQESQQQNTDDKKFIHVLVDMMIQLLTKSTSYLRSIINSCFTQFLDEVDAFCLNTITDVLVKPNLEFINQIEENEEQDIQNQMKDESEQESADQNQSIEQEEEE